MRENIIVQMLMKRNNIDPMCYTVLPCNGHKSSYNRNRSIEVVEEQNAEKNRDSIKTTSTHR